MITSNDPVDLLKSKRILITGGLGFIGSTLAIRCVEAGAYVTIYDNLDHDSGGNLGNIRDIQNDVIWINRDLSDYETVCQQTVNKDIIFNCAARTSHSLSMSDPWADLNANVHGVITLLEACRVTNPSSQIIQLGTTTQFGPLQFRPATEKHPEFPLDVYSANKVTAEKYVHIYSNAYNLKTAIVRLPNIYGPRAAIDRADLTFNNFFIGLAAQNKPISVFEPGTQLRNLLFIDDAVNALIASLNCTDGNDNIYLVAGDQHYSVLQIATHIAATFDSSVCLRSWPTDRTVTEVGDVVLDDSHFRKTTGWKPVVGISEGLSLTKRYLSDRLDEYLPNMVIREHSNNK